MAITSPASRTSVSRTERGHPRRAAAPAALLDPFPSAEGAFPMTSHARTIRAQHGLRRPRAVGILVAATLIAATTYLAGAIQAPPASRSDPSRDATLLAPGTAGTVAAGSVEQLDRSISIWSG